MMRQSKEERNGKSRGNRADKRGNKRQGIGGRGLETLENIDENSPVIKFFMNCRKELDKKHDRYEKLVKLSRDITIESKRIIFLLHTFCSSKPEKQDEILTEAETRLNNLVSSSFKSVSEELNSEDQYQYNRAFTSGMQEFVEALTFYSYLKFGSLCGWSDIRKKLIYTQLDEDDTHSEIKTSSLIVTPADYLLGVEDMTGEMMRLCINSLATGNVDGSFKSCSFVRNLYTRLLSLNNVGSKEYFKKLSVTKQSLEKMENFCYMIHTRASEIENKVIADIVTSKIEDSRVDEDEGFY